MQKYQECTTRDGKTTCSDKWNNIGVRDDQVCLGGDLGNLSFHSNEQTKKFFKDGENAEHQDCSANNEFP